jgi:uncharacterized protein DUF6524
VLGCVNRRYAVLHVRDGVLTHRADLEYCTEMYGIAQPIGILVRLLAVQFLVTASYNPSGYSYWHWTFRGDGDYWALKVFIGLLLIFGYVFCIYSTWRSLRIMLSVPLLLVIGACLWLLSDWGIVDFSNSVQRTLALETALVVLLGTGVSFSLIRYRLSGQLDSRTIT